MRTRDLHAAEFALRVADFEVTQAQAALMQARHPESEKSGALQILAPVGGYVLNVNEESARVVTPGLQYAPIGKGVLVLTTLVAALENLHRRTGGAN